MSKCASICVILVAGLSACDQPGLHQGSVAQVSAPTPATSTAAPLGIKIDQVPAERLKSGLDAVMPLISARREAYAPIAPVANKRRLFMHPLADKDASVEIDVSGLSSLTLSPYIEDLSQNPPCAPRPEAGIVAMSWSLDGSAPTTVTVDQTYNALVKLDTSAARTLKISVNSGNGTNTCDWASVGFVDVVRK